LANNACAAGAIVKINFAPPNPAGNGNNPWGGSGVLSSGSTIQNAYLAYVDSDATKLKKLNSGCPVMLMYMGEQNLTGSLNTSSGYWANINAAGSGVPSSSQWAALYVLTFNRLKTDGVGSIVLMGMEPNGGVGNYTFGFPGTSYVDVMALDGFPIGTGDGNHSSSGSTWYQLYNICPNCPEFYGSTGFSSPGSVTPFSGNNYTQVCNVLTTNYPFVFGWFAFTQGGQLAQQNGAVNALSSSPWINVSSLPNFTTAGGVMQ
jgi:hypothetical protein